MGNLYSIFKEHNNTANIMLVTENSKISFNTIDHFSSKYANLLYKLNIRKGDRVAAQIEKSEHNLFLYFACLRSGIIFLPLNNTYTLHELNYFFDDAKPKLVVCDPTKEESIKEIIDTEFSSIKTLDAQGNGSLTEQLKNESEKHLIIDTNLDDIAVILYTSGTTGKPKGAMITHQGLLNNTTDLIKAWGITKDDTILHMLPLFHVHGLFFAINTAFLSGAQTILLPKFDLDLFFHYLNDSTIFMGVPTYYSRLLKDARLNQETCRNMRLFISGSAPLLVQPFDEFKYKTGHTILERYGMTETGINTSNPLNGKRKAGTVGLPLSSVNLRIVSNNNTSCAQNEIGLVEIKGANLFKGYWRNQEKTNESFTEDGYFKTGDMGFLDSEGYLTLIGREKDMIISGGLNVYPKEIEETLDSLDGVIESAVIGIPHHDYGEAVVAIISTKKQFNEPELLTYIKEKHAGYKCPKKIFFVDDLPKNTMGKVQKNLLRQQFSNIF
ncbi:MAG: AMP-binding protein [Legionellales bacterium]|nr:AMP-binding protein [Legionellales bacterium]